MELILNSQKASPAVCRYDEADDPVISRFRWYLVQVGPSKKRYVHTYLNGHSLSMHRLILANSCQGREIDHINGDGLDNRRDNLRICTRAENVQNSSGHRRRKCLYKGVSQVKRITGRKGGRQWEARICVDGKQRVIGLFHDALEAAKAYDIWARLLHGRFARLNFPKEGERGLR